MKRAIVLTATLFACGSSGNDDAKAEPRAPATFDLVPTQVSATRAIMKGACGSYEPTEVDLLKLYAERNAEPASKIEAVQVAFRPTATIDAPITLTIATDDEQRWADGARAFLRSDQLGTEAVVFVKHGSQKPLASVTMTPLAVPNGSGDELAVQLRVEFVDGDILDRTFAAKAVVEPVQCHFP